MTNATDPGLEGVVPFRFACHRCGNCCTGGAGQVWVDAAEVAPMARRLEMTEEAFTERYLRRATDPRSGEIRLSLRERGEASPLPGLNSSSGGSCALLEGANQCSVYEDRPAHCRDFPYWPGVLEDERAFEEARATCPGIRVEVSDEVRAEAFARLEALFREVDAFVARSRSVCIMRGVCCRFEEAGHELFATGLEADYAAERLPDAPPPEAPGRYPYHVAGKCTARDARPLGCRTYFCDVRTTSVMEEAHEHFLRRLRTIERETGYPASYARFPELLKRRGVGTTE
ncbi:MAG: YkgJ family cysteine cluster protein [Planctomycetota bacterium]